MNRMQLMTRIHVTQRVSLGCASVGLIRVLCALKKAI